MNLERLSVKSTLHLVQTYRYLIIFSNFFDNLISDRTQKCEAFRNHYPAGENFIVSHNIDTAFTKRYKELTIHFVNA